MPPLLPLICPPGATSSSNKELTRTAPAPCSLTQKSPTQCFPGATGNSALGRGGGPTRAPRRGGEWVVAPPGNAPAAPASAHVQAHKRSRFTALQVRRRSPWTPRRGLASSHANPLPARTPLARQHRWRGRQTARKWRRSEPCGAEGARQARGVGRGLAQGLTKAQAQMQVLRHPRITSRPPRRWRWRWRPFTRLTATPRWVRPI